MRHRVAAIVLAGLVVVAAACSGAATAPPFSEADAAAIRARAEAYVKAVRDNDWTTWADLYVADAMVLPPNGPAIRGRESMIQWARALPPITSFTRTSDELEGSGNMAYLRGGYQWVLSPPGAAAMPDTGKYLQIWRKQTDGTWHVVRSVFSSDLPAPAPKPSRK
jgi:ketosteroid isomerase-like protein